MDENDDYWNNGEGWEPIGNYIYGDSDSEEPFTAVFNGNDYKILNLYIYMLKVSVHVVGLSCILVKCDYYMDDDDG